MMSNQLNLLDCALLGKEAEILKSLPFPTNLNHLFGKSVVFTGPSPVLYPLDGWENNRDDVTVKTFKPVKNERQIISIDSSCITVGETNEGTIFGARATVVLSQQGKVSRYYRLGPVIVYASEDTNGEIADYSSDGGVLSDFILTESSLIEKLIRTRLERSLLREIASSTSSCVFLVDGSLPYSPFEPKENSMHAIVELAHSSGNEVVGLSKTTKLKYLQRLMGHLLGVPVPCYLAANELLRPVSRTVYGMITLVNFFDGVIPLRVDLASFDIDEVENILGILAYSEHFHAGYPESLKLAHHLSVFSALEVTSLRSFIVRNFSLKEALSIDPRATFLSV